MKLQVAAAIAAASAKATLKVGVIGDLHMNMAYDSMGSDSDNCIKGNSSDSYSKIEEAPLARFNCDPSSTLVDYMLTRFTEVFGDVDVLLVNGDHIAHGIAPHHDVATEADW